jgi:hypothetical protein
MIATNADPNLILTALWTLIKGVGVSDNIFISNRPSVADIDDFIVIDINGMVRDNAGHARCVCLVQLFARDVDKKGTMDMTKLTEMYSTLLGVLPSNISPYTFDKKNQVGRRDIFGFHATLVNLDCLIY